MYVAKIFGYAGYIEINAFITGAKFGNLDYAGDDILNVSVTIKYDWATYDSTPPML